ncbi:hypothetical protein, partial [Vibrio cholerae]|uniref:hypothetical protein n=1 Tax=Vibrio cholerae TaxID=666 RepID=UPI0019D714DD
NDVKHKLRRQYGGDTQFGEPSFRLFRYGCVRLRDGFESRWLADRTFFFAFGAAFVCSDVPIPDAGLPAWFSVVISAFLRFLIDGLPFTAAVCFSDVIFLVFLKALCFKF